MFIIRDLMWNLGNLQKFPLPNPDPLQTEDGLYEAILVDTYYVPLMAKVLLLFDLRTSLMFDEIDNTAVLICEQIVKLSISETQDTSIWNVGTSRIHFHKETIQIELKDLLINRSIKIEAKRLYYLQGIVEGIGECSDSIDMDNLTPYLKTTPNLNSQLKINSISNLSADG